MKRILKAAMLLALPVLAGAQEAKTIFNSGGNARIGGFGAPVAEFFELQDEFALSVVGGGAVVVNDFFIGIYGGQSDLITRIELDEQMHQLELVQGGLWLGYTPISQKAVHPYFSARFGMGGTTLTPEALLEEDGAGRWDNFQVITGEAGVELNLFRWFRLAATAGYRRVGGVDRFGPELDDKELSGLMGAVTMRFGGFGYRKSEK